ncbi:ABC transporter ATP-binding protein [Alkalihalobacillus trypoxylicola]|uniref:ABC transporter ATP-binding protein n=1 Tax=Alkalihalobacillus trypoxylicola TaxID=519424 RepID=UPI0007DC0B18|nr:ABC transporter ATP-binding protein [Alkalihalobacillus trypoxylicola]
MIIKVENIHKKYGREPILNGVSFEITFPTITALVAPNGSGKSTLMNIITNLEKFDKGSVEIMGMKNTDPVIFKHISYMQDNSVLYNHLTGYDHLQFIAEVHSVPKKQLLELITYIGIDSYIHKKVKQYSLGMKQHLLLTMALINKPKLLILDEPLNGLDPTSSIRVRELLLQLKNEGTTVLLSSHNLAEVDQVTSDILFLKDGKLISENLKNNQTAFYMMNVQPLDKAINILNNTKVGFSVVDTSIKVEITKKEQLNFILKQFYESEIEITDISRQSVGSEARYNELFNKEQNHAKPII